MINEYQIRVKPEVAAQEDRLKAYLSDEYGINANEIFGVRILKRSIDARQRQIYVNLKVRAYVNELPKDDEYQRTEYPNVEGKPQVIVVGAGPGGLFAALRLIELGLRPIVLERSHYTTTTICRQPIPKMVPMPFTNWCLRKMPC